jgi:hypothetical protein
VIAKGVHVQDYIYKLKTIVIELNKKHGAVGSLSEDEAFPKLLWVVENDPPAEVAAVEEDDGLPMVMDHHAIVSNFLKRVHLQYIESGLIGAEFEFTPAEGEFEPSFICIRSTKNFHSIVFKYQNVVWQSFDRKTSRQEPSVLGRAGILNIVCEKINSLAEKYNLEFSDFTIRNLAELMHADVEKEDEDSIDTSERYLRRLDNSEFISPARAKKLVQLLKLEKDDLFFEQSTYLDTEAQKRRRQRIRKARKISKKTRQIYVVPLIRLDILADLDSVSRLNLLSEEPEFHSQLQLLPTNDEKTKFRNLAMVSFKYAVDKVRKMSASTEIVATSLVELKAQHVTAWYGEYEDRRPITHGDVESIEWQEGATSIWKVIPVFLFTEASVQQPNLTVLITSKSRFGSTLEDLYPFPDE